MRFSKAPAGSSWREHRANEREQIYRATLKRARRQARALLHSLGDRRRPVIAALKASPWSGFAYSLREQLRQTGTLSRRQIRAAERMGRKLLAKKGKGSHYERQSPERPTTNHA